MEMDEIKYNDAGNALSGKQWTTLAVSMKCIYGSQNFLSNKYALQLWYSQLKDIPYDVLNIAVQKYIMTEHFPPTPADIRKLAAEVVTTESADWSNGWDAVIKAMSFYGQCLYDPDRKAEMMASFDPITRQCVDRLGWNNLCTSENIVADRANFRQIYTQIADRKKADAVLSQSLLQKIEAKRQQLQLEATGNALLEGGE